MTDPRFSDEHTATPRAARITVPRHVLIEREAELDLAEQAARAVARGVGSVVAVTGPFGNGKSALLRAMALIAERERMTVLRASGARLERDFPYGVTRQLVDAARRDAPGKGVDRNIRVPFELDAEIPATMVVVDDVQWADEPSLRWLARLATGPERRPLLLVCAARDGDPHAADTLVRTVLDSAGSVLRPRPLSLHGVATLVKEQTGQDGAAEFVQACHQVTGGNPMFLMALLIELSIEDVEPSERSVERVRSARPAQLRDRLLACLRYQPEPVQLLAKAITILGEHADPELVERLAGLDTVAVTTALRTLHRLGLLAGRGVARFAHQLVHDAVEESMTVQEREQVALHAVELLRHSGRPVEQVATQLLGISSTQLPWAAETLRAAADAAMHRGAPQDATRYLRRILLDTAPGSADRAAVHVELALAQRGVDAATSMQHVVKAVELFDTPRERAAAVVRLPLTMLHDPVPSVGELVRSIARELGNPAELTDVDREMALRVAAREKFLRRRDPAVLTQAARALAGCSGRPPATLGEREMRAVLVYCATTVVGATAAEVAEQARLVLAREPAVPELVHGVGPLVVTALCAADAPDALVPWLDMAVRHAETARESAELGLLRAHQALALLHQGRLREAGTTARSVLRTGAVDWRRTGAAALLPLASVAVGTRDDELIRWLLANPPSGDDGHAGTEPMLGIVRALALAEADDTNSALALAMDAGGRLERLGWRNPVLFPWRTIAAMLRNRLGNTEEALELARAEYARAWEWGALSAIGRAGAVVGALTPGERGIRLLHESVEMLGGSGNKAELALALLRLGRRLADTDRHAAAEQLRLAHDVALACGDLRTANRALRTTSGGLKPKELTKSERRVVQLAVDGLTNGEIAHELDVSVRAVEKHLTNSYRKLRVSNRAELSQGLHDARDYFE